MILGYHAHLLGNSARTDQSNTAPWLLLHGFTGLGIDWFHIWPEDHPALAIDLPGHGQSPPPKASYEAEIRRLFDSLPDTIDSLAGYSLGGRIALSLMTCAPKRFRQLIILSAHPGLTDKAEREMRCIQDQVWIDCLQDKGIQRFAAAWQRQALFQSQHRRNPAAVRAQHRRRLMQSPDGLARNLACFGLGQMPPTWDAIRDYNGTLHWISGAEDTKFSAIGDQVRELRPATRHDKISECGHNPMIEAPMRLAELLR